MNCNHKWIVTEKMPSIGKEWVVENGIKKEKWYHIYKCTICGEEKRMSEDEAGFSMFDADALNEIVMKAVDSDAYWSTKINEFFDALNNISYDDKVSFMIKLINNKDRFNEFTKELNKSYDAFNVYESYR